LIAEVRARIYRALRPLILLAGLGGAVALAIAGHAATGFCVFVGTGAVLYALGWGIPTYSTDPDTFDARLRLQAIVIGVLAVAALVIGLPLVLLGVWHAKEPGILIPALVLFAGAGMYLCLRSVQFLREGGGGAVAARQFRKRSPFRRDAPGS
jgi:hypothetical protein